MLTKIDRLNDLAQIPLGEMTEEELTEFTELNQEAWANWRKIQGGEYILDK